MQKPYTKFTLILVLLFSFTVYGQNGYLNKIQDFLNHQKISARSATGDFSDLKIYQKVYTESMDIEHVYTAQRVNGIPVFNAVGNFAFKNDKIVYAANNFHTQINQRINAAAPQLSASEAVTRAAQQLGFQLKGKPSVFSQKGKYNLVLSKSGISTYEIPAKLVYQPMPNNSLKLAWDIIIYEVGGEHWWSLRVDALTGKILKKHDLILHCSFGKHAFANASHTHKQATKNPAFGRNSSSFLAAGAQYKVFPFYTESPNHGSRELLVDPANTTASPYGWHDTNGAPGAEYTYTKGNNVFAFEDRDGNEIPGHSPDGGADLNFVFPLDFNQDPKNYKDAAITNLFYMNNVLHDVWYQYGFDEEAGNFQFTNYTGKTGDGDYVIAMAQQGANSGPGNNANFGTPPDGQSPKMRMFTWSSASVPDVLKISSGALQGTYKGTFAGFGPSLPENGITADLVLLVDSNGGTSGSTDPNDACDPVTNPSELAGKIAVLRRGTCNFDAKVLKAQKAGAKAVIVVNNEKGLITMAGDNPLINIPSVLIQKIDGEAIITGLKAGSTINATLKNYGPYQLDGDFDNGIIAHEYGHGVSNRLTGGKNLATCLLNDEQMGEGWSDFFGLVLTMQSGDKATDSRGYGTYVIGEGVNGDGIRQHPYTTDMSVNKFTYANVAEQTYIDENGEEQVSAHGVGSIWATMLWDMTWALIDKYGYDPDVYNGTGGNNMAIQLVIDGLKLQKCSPGFINGRDAILEADKNLTGGDNQKLIWEVFARRGLGYSADQGSEFSITDQVEAFDMPPGLATEDFEKINTFRVYPNPVSSGVLNIETTEVQGKLQIDLYDIQGQKIMSKETNMNGQATLTTSELSTGIYILKLTSKGKTQTEKLIVQ